MGTFSPQTPLALSTLALWAGFQASFQVPQPGWPFPSREGDTCAQKGLHAPHSCLPMKIFPSLKKVRKNLTFLFFAFLFLKFRYSCFTVLFLPYNEVNQPYVYIYPPPPPRASFPPWPLPSHHRVPGGLPVWAEASHWLWFTYIGVDMSILLFQVVHHPQPVFTCLFYMSVCVLSRV